MLSFLKKHKTIDVAQLYEQFGRKLYGYAVSKWNVSEDDAWDLVYKTLYKVIEVSDKYTFENENKLGGFLFKIFVNYLRNHYRDNKDKQLQMIEVTAIENVAVEKQEAHEPPSDKMKCLQLELEKFDDWQRVLLMMRAQDFSYEEIEKYVNKPSSQLKVYYMRLKKQLTEKINECLIACSNVR